MSTETNTSKLIINKLTKAQYENIEEPSATELYMVTDEAINITDVDGLQNALNTKQNITDNTLTTTAKTIVGAINEVNAKEPELDEYTANEIETLWESI